MGRGGSSAGVGHPTSVDLPDEMVRRIEALARAESRSRQKMIAILLGEAIAGRREKRRT